MKKFFYLALALFFIKCSSSKQATTNRTISDAAQNYYTLQVYHLSNNDQLSLVENYLKSAWLPALHRNGIAHVGVFKPITNDTATDKKIVVFTPYTSLQQYENMRQRLLTDITLEQQTPAYVNAPYDSPPYSRYETILLHAFKDMPGTAVPQLKGAKKDRVYELRSYESPTEKMFVNKVHMFNEGGEVPLFKRLNFNAVFYASVIAGAHMPNLMYMTSFENMADREAHWKAFGDDPEWKTLSVKPEYQHNVSRNDILFLTPTDYSDF
ncbi:MAG TPA: NIPSNAP family protein [Chitinophagaceae bacterium]|nr:NIPSNAP family protein [Chitinophagaceae bacterium]